MIYVKHQEKNRCESVRQGTSVFYRAPTVSECAEVVLFGDPDPVSGDCTKFCDGIIYVMNESGATISKFDLN